MHLVCPKCGAKNRVPPLILSCRGQETARLSGAVSAQDLQRWVQFCLPAGAAR